MCGSRLALYGSRHETPHVLGEWHEWWGRGGKFWNLTIHKERRDYRPCQVAHRKQKKLIGSAGYLLKWGSFSLTIQSFRDSSTDIYLLPAFFYELRRYSHWMWRFGKTLTPLLFLPQGLKRYPSIPFAQISLYFLPFVPWTLILTDFHFMGW